MKTAAKIFTILGILSLFISVIVNIATSSTYVDSFVKSIYEMYNSAGLSIPPEFKETLSSIAKTMLIGGIIVNIGGIAIGITHVVFLFQNKSKKQCLPTAILTLIFVNIIAGILSLCMRDEHYLL